MTEVMSVRQEWYAESVYDETPWPPAHTREARELGRESSMPPGLAQGGIIRQGSWSGLPSIQPPPSPLNLKPGSLFRDKDGNVIGIVSSYDASTGQVTLITGGIVNSRRAGKQAALDLQVSLYAATAPMRDGLKKIGQALAKLMPPAVPENETPRDRALRLKKQPHSMTGKDGKFDSHGRCRY